MFFEGRLEWPSRDASVVRLKVEWVSSLARLAHRLKWGLRRRIILQFNKLINVIWQVVSSALGGSRHSLQSHLRACSITMLTKAWTGSEREMTAIWGWLCDTADLLLKKVTLDSGGSVWGRFIAFFKTAPRGHIVGNWQPPYWQLFGRDHEIKLKYFCTHIQAKTTHLTRREIDI